jgi:hypothetical protein
VHHIQSRGAPQRGQRAGRASRADAQWGRGRCWQQQQPRPSNRSRAAIINLCLPSTVDNRQGVGMILRRIHPHTLSIIGGGWC